MNEKKIHILSLLAALTSAVIFGMSFMFSKLALEVAQARSRASSISTDKPRPAASAAIPAPLMPPPITIRSLISTLAPRSLSFKLINVRYRSL